MYAKIGMDAMPKTLSILTILAGTAAGLLILDT